MEGARRPLHILPRAESGGGSAIGERVSSLLRERQWELTADESEADLILVNTCAIREKAEEKVFSKLGELRELKTRRPELVIGVMGCMAQLHQGAIQRRAPTVDLVF